jgi:hypothetical protein
LPLSAGRAVLLSAAMTVDSRSLRLEALDRALTRNPDAIEPRHERAGLLREERRFEAAKQDYLEICAASRTILAR